MRQHVPPEPTTPPTLPPTKPRDAPWISALDQPNEAWFRASKRVLEITIEDGHLKAYAHGLNDDGTKTMHGFGLQGTVRPQVLEGVQDLVADFVWGRDSRAASSQQEPQA